jgi:hypothetical protein
MQNPFIPQPGAVQTNNAPTPGAQMGGTAADNYEIDLTDVQDGFTIPDGKYEVACIDVEQSVSKGGNPMFVWTFQVADGPHAGFESKVFTAITPAAMWKVAETVQALGVGQTGSVVKFKRSDVINRRCGALIETTEYNGQTRSQITRVMTIEEMKKMD